MMETYFIEYHDITISRPNNTERPRRLHIMANDFFDAAVKAIPILLRTPHDMEVYNATIVRMRDCERYEILKERNWLVDKKTGRKLESKV